MAEHQVHQFTFEGQTISYDAKALHSWRVQKQLTLGGAGAYDAVDAILCGKSDEVAELLGDDADKMVELLSALGAITGEAKN